MATKLNLNGIHELDLTFGGTTTAAISAPGVVSVTNTATFTGLTTTGTSGPATLVSGILNIPQYAGAVSSLTTTGTSGAATLSGGVLNIPVYSSGASGVTSFNTRTGAVVPASGDYTVSQVTGAAPIASPTFTGTPAAPTATSGTNTTQLATTAFVTAAVAAGGVVTSVFGRTGAVVATSGDYSVSQVTGAAPLASPTFTGVPAAPTPSPTDNSTTIATTAFVQTAVGNYLPLTGGTLSGSLTVDAEIIEVNPASSGTVTLLDISNNAGSWAGLQVQSISNVVSFTAKNQFAGYSSFMSANPSGKPSLVANGPSVYMYGLGFGFASGVPSASVVGGFFQASASTVLNLSASSAGTAPMTLNVIGTVNASVGFQVGGTALAASNLSNGTTGTGAVALAASPTFTGTPAGPTASPGTNTTQLATTAFVTAAVSAGGAVASVFGRTGVVVATSGDYTVAQVTGAAALASPTFTGTPAAPTATSGTNTTQLATTAFVHTAVSTLAPLASPTFTGTPAAPTATSGTNTTQLATTAFVNAAVATATQTIASGTAVLGTSAIAAGSSATVVSVAATGVLTTDNVLADFNADPTSTAGYTPSTSGGLTIVKYPTAGFVNFKVVNFTGLSITPGAVTLNWRVVR